MADHQRFEVLKDPVDGWLVWDRLQETPAQFSAIVLYGLSEKEARSICSLMNNIGNDKSDSNSRAG